MVGGFADVLFSIKKLLNYIQHDTPPGRYYSSPDFLKISSKLNIFHRQKVKDLKIIKKAKHSTFMAQFVVKILFQVYRKFNHYFHPSSRDNCHTS